MVVLDTKIYQKMKNKSCLSIEKNIKNKKKTPYYNYKKLFKKHLENFHVFLKGCKLILRSYLKSFFDKEQIKTKYQDFFKENSSENLFLKKKF